MKYLVIFLNLTILLGSSDISAQGVWDQYGSSSSKKSTSGDQKPFGLMVGGDGGFLGRSGDATMADGSIYAGMLFGRKELQFVMMAGSYGQSEVVKYSGDTYDAVCGCYTQTTLRDFENHLSVGYFQAGFAYAKQNTALYATVGIAQVNRKIPTWVPLNDSLETLEMVKLPRETVLSGSFSGMFKTNSDIVMIEGQGFLSSEIFGRVRASYLLGFDQGQFYGGPLVGFNSNAVTGFNPISDFEYSPGYELLVGPQLLISGTDEMNIFQANLSGGVAYNTVPGKGIGFWVNFSLSVSRLNKKIFP